MKKFFITLIASIFLILPSKSHAADIFVGTSSVTGYNCYLMTETINGRHQNETFVTLKMVSESGKTSYLDYIFYVDGNFKNSQGFKGRVNKYDTPIEFEMYEYLWNR